MKQVIKSSILAILDRIIKAVEERDTLTLSKLSNYTIHNSSIFQDDDSLSIAIITYSLSKILHREKEIIPIGDKTIIKSFLINLNKMKSALWKDNHDIYRARISNIFKSINKLDEKTSEYVEQVILKSKIKKGTVMFQHGISLSRVAATLGITKWDLQGYLSNTSSAEKDPKVIKRVKFTKNLFGV